MNSMCRRAGESVDHFLLHCDVANALWRDVLQIFGIQWAMPELVMSLLFCWRNCLGSMVWIFET